MKDQQLEVLTRIAVALEQLALIADYTPEQIKTEKSQIKKEQLEESKAVSYTHEDLKTACLTASRANQENKPKLKALLKEYGANKAVEVPLEKLEEVITKINKGEF